MYSCECSGLPILTKSALQRAYVMGIDILTPFMPGLNIKGRCKALHCDFAFFDVSGSAMYVEAVCLNLDVPMSTMYCRKALQTVI